jgi:hypothetical protein
MYKFIFVFVLFSLIACDSKPKVIVEDVATTAASTQDAQANIPSIANNTNEMHQVVSLDVLHTDKYTYMQVVENSDTFWVAASKFEAKKGNKYFYRGGLMKTNFFRQEFNRTFDKVFLVSSIVDASAHPGNNGESQSTGLNLDVKPSEIKSLAGAISLKDLMKNKSKYEGKPIVVSGKVVKVNSGIMNKNWIHLQDGNSEKGKPLDLTITTQENIPLGVVVNMEGKIVLNKDFGAGYKYDIIMEEAVVKK